MPDNNEKNLIEEILDDVYPKKSSEAISDFGILLLGYFVWGLFFRESGTSVFLVLSVASGIKYFFKRNTWVAGGLLGTLLRIVLVVPLGAVYMPFMVWFAVRRLRGKGKPTNV